MAKRVKCAYCDFKGTTQQLAGHSRWCKARAKALKKTTKRNNPPTAGRKRLDNPSGIKRIPAIISLDFTNHTFEIEMLTEA